MMTALCQRTLERPAEVSGIGFFTNTGTTCRMLPAAPDTGIVLVRADLPDAIEIPATIDYAVERHRRTALERHGASVELTEHLLAALAGLNIDNCRVELTGPEPPGGDGSARHFVDAILAAGIVSQDRPAHVCAITEPASVPLPNSTGGVSAIPVADGRLLLRYDLDYGPDSPVPPQSASFTVTPETFAAEIASARTFILESEVAVLRSHGYGWKITAADLLVFGTSGVVGNTLRFENECARHKLLDCLGDFALIGGRLAGRFHAARSGHAHNRDLIRRVTGIRPATTAVREAA